MFMGLWFSLQSVSSIFFTPLLASWPWVLSALNWLLGAGIVLGMGFLIAPVTSVFAGVFLDEVAEEVEKTYYPQDQIGTALSLSQSSAITMRFFLLVLIGNFIALLLVLFLGLGVLIFFLLNGYLLGIEYFQFAALRHHPMAEVKQLRKKFSFEIFIAGLAIAVLLSIPVVNLLTPLFAGALMVHVYKSVRGKITN